MSRPCIKNEDKRIYQVGIRLTQSELHTIKINAACYGMSLQQYFICKALKKKPKNSFLSPINREILIQLYRIGNNLNQLTKAANSGRYVSTELKSVLRDLKQLLFSIKNILLGT